MGLILPLTWNNEIDKPPIGRIEIFEDGFLEKLEAAWSDGSEFCVGGFATKKQNGDLVWKVLSFFPSPANPSAPETQVQLIITHEHSFGGG